MEEQETEKSADVEGHRAYSTSDRNVKDHVEPVSWDQDEPEAASGQGRGSKAPQSDEDDVEGHRPNRL